MATHDKPTSSFIAVTPEIAQRWLQRNKVNRRLDQNAVNRYASMMRNGEWTLDSNAIVFDTRANLIQGQHRLNAVAVSGETVTFNVVRNAPSESMRYMDRGRTRTVSQNLHLMDGEANSNVLAASTRILKSLELGSVAAITDAHVYEFVANDLDIRRAAYVGMATKNDIDAPPSAIAAAYWLIASRNGQDITDQFFNALQTRADLPKGSPILALDRRLRIERRSGRKYRSVVFTLLIARAWNYYATGRELQNISMPTEKYAIPKVHLLNGAKK